MRPNRKLKSEDVGPDFVLFTQVKKSGNKRVITNVGIEGMYEDHVISKATMYLSL